MPRPFGWFDIIRIGLLQTALGAILVLTTSTLNRVMVVEYALPATLPGLLVGIHHAAQMLRPRWGFASDRGGRRTPWIVGGMAVLAIGGFLAATATALMASQPEAGLALAVVAFILIGMGVGAAGTNGLILLSERVEDGRREPAATIVWVMMIVGFILTAAFGGKALDPYSPERLMAVSGAVSVAAFLLSLVAVAGLEGRSPRRSPMGGADLPFSAMLASVWRDGTARRFTLFIFVSMLAYSAQDLILEPYAGLLFGMTPGETTRLGGVQNGGVLAGMVAAGLVGFMASGRSSVLGLLVVGGCIGSAVSLLLIADAADGGLPITVLVALLGLANGVFAVSAIGMMMGLAGKGPEGSRGTRMGLWGAAQAIAFGVGGLAGTVAVDLVSLSTGEQVLSYQIVFASEGVLFLVAAIMAFVLLGQPGAIASEPMLRAGDAGE